jgi:hypothetical protein
MRVLNRIEVVIAPAVTPKRVQFKYMTWRKDDETIRDDIGFAVGTRLLEQDTAIPPGICVG